MKELVLVGSLVTVGSAFAMPGLEVDVSAGVIGYKSSGVIQYPVPGGDVIDIKKDLGLGEESKVFGRVKFEHFLPLLPNLYLQYMPMEFTGSGNISRDIKYGQTTYTVNTRVDSKVQLDRFDLGLYYGIPLMSTFLDPEIGVNVRIMDFNGSIRSSGLVSQTESKSATIPIPMLYGALGVNLPVIPVSFRGEIRGVSVSKVTYYDLTLEGRVKPLKLVPLYLSTGYRYEKLKIDGISDIYTNLTIKGPFFMLGASF